MILRLQRPHERLQLAVRDPPHPADLAVLDHRHLGEAPVHIQPARSATRPSLPMRRHHHRTAEAATRHLRIRARSETGTVNRGDQMRRQARSLTLSTACPKPVPPTALASGRSHFDRRARRPFIMVLCQAGASRRLVKTHVPIASTNDRAESTAATAAGLTRGRCAQRRDRERTATNAHRRAGRARAASVLRH